MRTSKRKRRHMRSIRVVGWAHTLVHLRLTNAMESRRHYRTLLVQQLDNPRARPKQWAKWVSQEAMDIRKYRAFLRGKYIVLQEERSQWKTRKPR